VIVQPSRESAVRTCACSWSRAGISRGPYHDPERPKSGGGSICGSLAAQRVPGRSLGAAPVRKVRGYALAASAQPRNVREIDSDGAAPARKHTESASATLARRRRSTTIVAYGASHRRSEANQLFAHASRSQNRAFPSPALARRPRSVAEPVHAPFPASRSALSRLKPPQAAPSDAEALASPAVPRRRKRCASWAVSTALAQASSWVTSVDIA